jgi:hypothetical protein
MKKFILFLSLSLFFLSSLLGEEEFDFTWAVVKYKGGGDWYNGISGVENLLSQIIKRTSIKANPKVKILQITDADFFLYPFLYINGHGNIVFSPEEVSRLKTHLTNGGFLLINDDYGLDKHIRREMKKVFPEKDFQPVPFTHPIYHCFYRFPRGLPKIHEHDGHPPEGLGIWWEGRLVVFYAFSSDIGDGWEKAEVHGDPPEVREEAIKMGINIITYILTE